MPYPAVVPQLFMPQATKSSKSNSGFKDALGLMRMDSIVVDGDGDDDDDVNITPAPKKPRLVKEIAEALVISTPPVVGRQSVSLLRLEFFLGFGGKMYLPKAFVRGVLCLGAVNIFCLEVILTSWFWNVP